MNQNETNDTLIEEIVQLLLREKENAFPQILTKIYNEAMVVERAAHIGAGKYERAEKRDGYANGFKPRTLQTHVGKLSLLVPQVRGSSTRFNPKCLERGTRSERALMLAAAEMYIQGVSTRWVESVFQAMGLKIIPQSKCATQRAFLMRSCQSGENDRLRKPSRYCSLMRPIRK